MCIQPEILNKILTPIHRKISKRKEKLMTEREKKRKKPYDNLQKVQPKKLENLAGAASTAIARP